MGKTKYELLTTDGAPELKMRYYAAAGSQKGILVFVHGVSHGAWCWEFYVKYLTQRGYACFVVNLRGHGDDPNTANLKGSHLSDYVTDVIHCVDHCKNFCKENDIAYSKPVIIGHSMGGAIVQSYISDFSYEVSSAVLLASVTAGGMGWSGILKTSFSGSGLCTAPATLGWKKISSLLISRSNFFTNRLSKDQAKAYNEQLCKESFPAMFDLRKYDINTAIKTPILVVGSEADAYFGKESLVKTAAAYGISENDSSLKVVTDLCHDIMLDPEELENQEVIKYIYDFIEKNNS